MKDELEYFKEVRLQEEITVTFCACGSCSGRESLPPPARSLQARWKP